jgi:transposase
VAVKTVDQQVLQQLHRLRTQWQRAYKARINSLRGMLREFGIDIPVGLARGLAAIREALELADNGLPDALRPFIASVLAEIDGSMQRVEGPSERWQASPPRTWSCSSYSRHQEWD